MKEPEAHSEPFATTREMVDFINDRHISKADIVKILQINGQIFLIYFA